jgi:Ca-activated chloride channel family protein
MGQSQTPTFRAGTTVVTIPVSVRSRDRPVDGLTVEDFVVRDNDVEQRVESVSTEAIPLDVTVAVDTSTSTHGRLDDFKRRVAAMVALLGPRDRMRLLTFSDFVREVFPLQLASRIDLATVDSIVTERATAARNALIAAMVGVPDEPGRRRLAVVFTDGIDTWSSAQRSTVVDAARVADVTVYVGGQGHDAIAEVVDITGGRAHSTGSMVEVFQQILDEARGSYVLRYTPTGVALDGWHELDVGVRCPSRCEVRARRGYIGDASLPAPRAGRTRPSTPPVVSFTDARVPDARY